MQYSIELVRKDYEEAKRKGLKGRMKLLQDIAKELGYDLEAKNEHGNTNWTDWSKALHESSEIDTLNTFYSGIEA